MLGQFVNKDMDIVIEVSYRYSLFNLIYVRVNICIYVDTIYIVYIQYIHTSTCILCGMCMLIIEFPTVYFLRNIHYYQN